MCLIQFGRSARVTIDNLYDRTLKSPSKFMQNSKKGCGLCFERLLNSFRKI